MNQVCPKIKCTGCGACETGCPKRAISLKADKCGYFYPQINQDSCVDCGICQKICPSVSLQPLLYPIDNLAVIAKAKEEILSCASGGAATILSTTIIENGGVVYGCDGTDIRNVHHVRIDCLSGLTRLKGSKYVQSRIGSVYHQVKNDLNEGRKVLFIGTPCQVAGLKGYLQNKNIETLYVADLVCHGVPSQQMLNDNIDYYTTTRGEVCNVSFRKKIERSKNPISDAEYRITYGWFFQTTHKGRVVSKSLPFHKDSYMLGFISGLTFRPNCYECRYACIARCSDITLSDYWGLAQNAGFENGMGVSNILVNTLRGQSLWDIAKNNTIYRHRDIIEALMGNGQLQAPSPRHPQHDKFAKLYPEVGFKKAVFVCSRKDLVKYYIKSAISFMCSKM